MNLERRAISNPQPPTSESILERCVDKNNPVFSALLSGEKAALRDMRTQLLLLPKNETFTLAKKLLKGLGQDTDEWDVDRRQVAGTIWSFIDFEQLTPKQLEVVKNTYAVALEKAAEEPNADPLGSIDSLLDAGMPLVSVVPYDESVEEGLDSVTAVFQHDPLWQNYLEPKVAAIRDPFSEAVSQIPVLSQHTTTINNIARELSLPPRKVWRTVRALKRAGKAQEVAIGDIDTEGQIWEVLELWNNQGKSKAEIAHILQISFKESDKRVHYLNKKGYSLQNKL